MLERLVEFCVLGRVAVVVDEHERVIRSGREAALLADLLVHAGEVVSASRLVEDIWRGEPPPGAAATLQTYVKNLRRMIEPERTGGRPSEVLVSRRPGYLLAIGPDAVDAGRSERMIAEGRAALADGLLHDAAARLRSALELWHGPAYGQLADESYVQSEARRLEELRLLATEELARADLALGRHAEICGELERLVADHPYRESLWELWMLALYRSGRQTDALRAADRLRRLLRDDLGIVPCDPLRELEQAILLHAPALDWTPPAQSDARGPFADKAVEPGPAIPLSARLVEAGATRFVGRYEELTVLADALQAAAEGRRRTVVLIGGEPGIGKTTLAGVFARNAHDRGSAVLYGRCDEELGLPYQPWATAIAHLVEHQPPRLLDEALATRGADIGRLSPLLAHLSSGATSAPDPDLARHLLFEAVTRVIQAAGRDRPVVIVLDDLHWADRTTLQLLRHVVGSDLLVPVVLVGSFRPSDLGPDHPLTELLPWLLVEPGVTRIDLEGLAVAELAELLAVVGGGAPEPSEDLLDAIAEQTDGNPFFVGELLRHYVDTGALTRAAGGGWSVTERLAEQPVPASVRTVIGARVNRLGGEALSVLSLAAVIGRDFELGVLAAAARMPHDDILDVLDRAIAAALVVNLAGEGFSFSHALIAQALYEAIAPARRVRAHHRVGEVIEGLGSGVTAERLPQLAHHFAEACATPEPGSDLPKAIAYARAAGDAALAGLAPDEALRWYRRAMALLDRSSPIDPAWQCELMVKIGDAERQSGNPRFRETLLGAGHLAQDLGLNEALVAAALASSRGVFSTTGRVDQRQFAMIDAALAATPHVDTGDRARLLSLRAVETITSEAYGARKALVDEATGIARRLDDPATLLDVIIRGLDAIHVPDTVAERLDLTAEAWDPLESTCRHASLSIL